MFEAICWFLPDNPVVGGIALIDKLLSDRAVQSTHSVAVEAYTCALTLESPDSMVGKIETCVHCGGQYIAPRLAAAATLRKLIDGKDVRLEFPVKTRRDNFGRLLARTYVGELDVAAAMISGTAVASNRQILLRSFPSNYGKTLARTAISPFFCVHFRIIVFCLYKFINSFFSGFYRENFLHFLILKRPASLVQFQSKPVYMSGRCVFSVLSTPSFPGL